MLGQALIPHLHGYVGHGIYIPNIVFSKEKVIEYPVNMRKFLECSIFFIKNAIKSHIFIKFSFLFFHEKFILIVLIESIEPVW